ncbi:MAG: hypothetical protein R3194_11270, partial [Limnobacter sp.]|nr:hypothetical protein [Limnobacter sp.]
WLGCATLSHEIRRATLQQVEAGLTQVKLGWWQTALAASKQQTAQHPVILAIGQDVVNQVGDGHWADLINAGVDACEPQRYERFDAWSNHLYELAKPWEQVLNAGLGSENGGELIQFWVHSIQLTQVLRLAKYVDQNFQPLPVDALARFNVTANDLKNRKYTAGTAQLLNEVGLNIEAQAEQAWRALPATLRLKARPMRALFLMRKAEMQLHRKEQFTHVLSEQKVLSPGRKFWISWKTQVLRS